jgi:putative ABC transport system substrate-binding protein
MLLSRHTRRREFITLLGGAAAAWPLSVRAQQSAKLQTIGFLGTASPSTWGPWTAAFMQRLRELGWTEGRNITIEVRWAEGRTERFAEIAAEFVRLKVDVIFTTGAAVAAAKKVTSVVPIVFALGRDPVGSGYVTKLARPDGNVTGLSSQSTDLVGKRLELLREVVPGLRRRAGNGVRFRQRPARSICRLQCWKSEQRPISRLPSRRSRIAQTQFMS